MGWVASLVLPACQLCSQFGVRWTHAAGGRCSLCRSCSLCHGGMGSPFGAIVDSAPRQISQLLKPTLVSFMCVYMLSISAISSRGSEVYVCLRL